MHIKLHSELCNPNLILNIHFKLHLKYAFQTPFKICISNSSLSPHFLTKVLSYSIPTQTTRLLIFYSNHSNHSSTHSLLKPLIHLFSTQTTHPLILYSNHSPIHFLLKPLIHSF